MDFYQWGQEYLDEAAVLKERIIQLRREKSLPTCTEPRDLERRIYLLYSMYLDCRATGHRLQSYAKTQTKGGRVA